MQEWIKRPTDADEDGEVFVTAAAKRSFPAVMKKEEKEAPKCIVL